MKSIESILPILHELLIEKLPLYIERINKEKNDGIIIKEFENKKLFETNIKIPSFKLIQEEAQITEKDRIIENTIFELKMEIKTGKTDEEENLYCLWRYAEAIGNIIEESDLEIEIKITKINNNTLFFRIKID